MLPNLISNLHNSLCYCCMRKTEKNSPVFNVTTMHPWVYRKGFWKAFINWGWRNFSQPAKENISHPNSVKMSTSPTKFTSGINIWIFYTNLDTKMEETSAWCKVINESKQTKWMLCAVCDDGYTPSTLREVQRCVMPWPPWDGRMPALLCRCQTRPQHGPLSASAADFLLLLPRMADPRPTSCSQAP